jgi:hypothetical protein
MRCRAVCGFFSFPCPRLETARPLSESLGARPFRMHGLPCVALVVASSAMHNAVSFVTEEYGQGKTTDSFIGEPSRCTSACCQGPCGGQGEHHWAALQESRVQCRWLSRSGPQPCGGCFLECLQTFNAIPNARIMAILYQGDGVRPMPTRNQITVHCRSVGYHMGVCRCLSSASP